MPHSVGQYVEVQRDHFSQSGKKIVKGSIYCCSAEPEPLWVRCYNDVLRTDAVSFIGPGLLMTPASARVK